MNSKLLVADDAPASHKLIRAALDGEEIDIHSAFSGEQAVVDAAALLPSIILLDLDMPGMDGFEVCQKLKANPPTRAIPIIFLTSDSSQNNQIKALNLGAIDFMSKEFKPEELRARIRAALRVRGEMEKLAMIDGLTGLWNGAYLDIHLAADLSHARRTNRPVACATADIDNLKHINRNHGQAVGDQIVRLIGHILTSQARAEDTTGYLTSGKFRTLLPGVNSAGAAKLANRVRAEVERQLMELDGLRINATCSFGIADTRSGGESTLLERADKALHCAKNAGRNRISISNPESPILNVRAVA